MKRKVSVLSGVFLVTASLVSSAEGQPVLAVPGYIVELVASGGIAADGLTLGSDGYVYITDFNGASNGALMRVPQNATNSVFQTIASGLANPTDVARTPAGRLFVPESANGNLTEAFLDGTTSVLATGFPTATSIEYTASGLVTTNSTPGTITTTDLGGSTQTILSGITFPYGATVAADGTLFFIEFGTGTLFQSDLAGTTPTAIGSTSAFGAQFTALDPLDTLFISDPLANAIWRLDGPGQLSLFASGFTGKTSLSVIGPTGIAFTSTGTLFVGDGPNLWRIAPLSPTQVTIDIKPGSDANTINLFSRFVSVAVLTTAIFDAATVDPTSVTLAGASVRMKGNSGTSGSLEDVDGDGDLDLVVQVLTEQMALTAGDIEAVLTGTTLGGTMIQGADTIRIVP